MSSIAGTDSTLLHDQQDLHDHKPRDYMNRWLFTTNHKDIGTLYLVFSLLMFFIGGAMAMVIRLELFMPGLQLVEPDFFNQMTMAIGPLIDTISMVLEGREGTAQEGRKLRNNKVGLQH